MNKYKLLSKEQLVISIDRLTRFKYTKEKYLRVFYDVILSCMVEPIYKKSVLEKMPAETIKELAEEIINASIEIYSGYISNDYIINDILLSYENSLFINDDETQILLNNSINYNAFIKLIDENSVVNLRWLKSLQKSSNSSQNRRDCCLKYPIEKVLLVEGLTEEILLPAFSRFLNYDFYKEGIQIFPAGGKNQVVKLYYKLAEELKIPIFLLLDKDAEDNILQIEPRLRDIDKIHLVSCGEFEDLLPKSLIIKSINKDLSNFADITEKDFDDTLSEVKNLEYIFKTKGLHEFKKADFAKLVRECITEPSDISDEIREIIDEIRK